MKVRSPMTTTINTHHSHSSICPTAYPSIHPSSHPSIHPSIYLIIHLFTYQSICPSMPSFIWYIPSFINLFPSIYSATYLFLLIHPPIHLFTHSYPSTHPSNFVMSVMKMYILNRLLVVKTGQALKPESVFAL